MFAPLDWDVLGYLWSRGWRGNVSQFALNQKCFEMLLEVSQLLRYGNYAKLAEREDVSDAVRKSCWKLQFYAYLYDGDSCRALSVLSDKLAGRCDVKESTRLSRIFFCNDREVIARMIEGEERKLHRMLPLAAGLESRLNDRLSAADKWMSLQQDPKHVFFNEIGVKETQHLDCKATNVAFTQNGIKTWDSSSNTSNALAFLWPPSHNWPETIFSSGSKAHCLALLNDKKRVIYSGEERLTVLSQLNDLTAVEHAWAPLRASFILTSEGREDDDDRDDLVLAIQNDGLIRQLSTRPEDNYQVLTEFGPPEKNILIAAAYLWKSVLILSANNDTVYWYSDWQEHRHPTRIFRGHRCNAFHSSLLVLAPPDCEGELEAVLVSGSEDARLVAWSVASGLKIWEHKMTAPVSQLLPKSQNEFYCLTTDGQLTEFAIQ